MIADGAAGTWQDPRSRARRPRTAYPCSVAPEARTAAENGRFGCVGSRAARAQARSVPDAACWLPAGSR